MSPVSMFPTWNAVHPLVIHFPLILFVVAPLIGLAAAFTKAAARGAVLVSCLVLMLLASTSLQLSYKTGEAAAHTAKGIGAEVVLEQHKEAAELARGSLMLATLLFGLTLLFCLRLHLPVRQLIGVLPLGAALFYGLGLFWLVQTAYQGERLVHEFGSGGITPP